VEAGADHFDLPDLSRFLEATELPRKVRGYVEGARASGALPPGQARPGLGTGRSSSSSVYCIAELLGALLGSTGSDRILCQVPTTDGETASLRYLSLDADARFRELLTSARAVIFAGGTLEPRAEFIPLYAGIGEAGAVAPSVRNFSGRHVVPSSHIFARYVTHGPEGHALDFRKDARSTPAQLSELRAILASTAAVTPGGVVFFFPSFEYLGEVAPRLGPRLGGRAVFAESRKSLGAWDEEETRCGGSGEVLLRDFAAAVHRDGGAVLLAVSGAKLSEGINFQNELCRLVAVVGLPYPNASDLGLTTKMRFLDGRRATGAPGLSGREFYAARCLKGVNQCIGRSIRHAGDWAAVLLLDHRYAHANINGSVSLKAMEPALFTWFAARSEQGGSSPTAAGAALACRSGAAERDKSELEPLAVH